MKHLELLAPARQAESGRIAIDYGADAVYIGGPAFGARYAATNTVEEIAKLADYAHLYGARVFVALNTVVFENELAEAERIAREVIAANPDALIIQDMAFMRMGLTGIEMHASTQMCNTSAEQVAFLENSGFARVILERGLTLEQIERIRQNTTVDLEAFIHGAICVAFSGQCYMSRSMGPRSGNRGECSQPCRLPYDLTDEDGKTLLSGKHLLSVQDMNLTDRIEALASAGVTSFKIEGRLKDDNYVKNVVAHYRRVIDDVISRSYGQYARASEGRSAVDFTPDPARTFSRAGGLWMTDGKKRGVASFDTPKAMGAYVGIVKNVGKDYFELDEKHDVTNGDGICFVSQTKACDGKQAMGTTVNRSENRRIYPDKMDGIRAGLKIYRNHDHSFSNILRKSQVKRVIDAKAAITVGDSSIEIALTDTRGNVSRSTLEGLSQPANDPQKMIDTLQTQVLKSGGSIFTVTEVDVIQSGSQTPFAPISAINDLRRRALEDLTAMRRTVPPRKQPIEDRNYPYPAKQAGGELNVTNSLARQFYADHGVGQIDTAFDLRDSLRGEQVMRTAYCIRREIGQCLKESRTTLGKELFIRSGRNTYKLEFDCARCEMIVRKE